MQHRVMICVGVLVCVHTVCVCEITTTHTRAHTRIICDNVYACFCVWCCDPADTYGVATIGRLLKITGLVCRISSLS